MKKIKKVVVICLLVLFCAVSVVQAEWCTGTIDRVLMTADGDVDIKATYRGDFTKICNRDNYWNDISPEVCADWYDTVVAARISGRTITIRYPDGTPCDTLPTYNDSPAPMYFMFR
jgi:hypothetical protein